MKNATKQTIIFIVIVILLCSACFILGTGFRSGDGKLSVQDRELIESIRQGNSELEQNYRQLDGKLENIKNGLSGINRLTESARKDLDGIFQKITEQNSKIDTRFDGMGALIRRSKDSAATAGGINQEIREEIYSFRSGSKK